MQKIPSIYGFSIITLVLVLMVINHFVYLRILEQGLAQVKTTPAPQSASQEVDATSEAEGQESAVDGDEVDDTAEADMSHEGMDMEEVPDGQAVTE